jgi:hypothetical protein
MGQLILKSANASRSSGEWSDDDCDVLAEGIVVGRIMKAGGNAVGQVHPKRCEARELTGRSISSRVLAHGPELLRTRVARVLAPGGRGSRALVTVGLRQ